MSDEVQMKSDEGWEKIEVSIHADIPHWGGHHP